MLHYTWGTVIKDSFGRKIWEFDKRTYTAEEIQRKVLALPARHAASFCTSTNCNSLECMAA